MSVNIDAIMPHGGSDTSISLPPGRDYGEVREMPNGRIICRRHGLGTCEICDVYYGWLDEVLPCDYPYESEMQALRQRDAKNDNSIQSWEEFVESYKEKVVAPRQIEAPKKIETPKQIAAPRQIELPRQIEDTDDFDPFHSIDDDPFVTAGANPGMTSKHDSRRAGSSLGSVATSLERRSGNGRVIPTIFTSPVTDPLALVKDECRSADSGETRYISRADDQTALVLVGGSCYNNGKPNAKAGWGVVFGPGNNRASGPLEKAGPFGGSFQPTSNRAKLRAVIAAIRSHRWEAEGLKNLIIATDSLYVVDGATTHVKKWLKTKFKVNEDLWRMLLGEVERQQELGVSIQLWHFSNSAGMHMPAEEIAQKAAGCSLNPNSWVDWQGV